MTSGARRIITAMIDRALSVCDQQGIEWGDFDAALAATTAGTLPDRIKEAMKSLGVDYETRPDGVC